MKRKNVFILPLVIMIIGYAVASVQEAHLPMAILFCGSVVVAWLCGQHATWMGEEEEKQKNKPD